jgi:hypothetical protein
VTPENRPAVRLHDAETRPYEAVAAVSVRGVPPKLARTLLTGEHVTFASTPHLIVFAQPLALMAAIAVALGAALHLSGVWREVAIVGGFTLLAGAGLMLLQRAARFAGLRIVSTNRRVFAIRGVLVRRMTPLGNTALAASTLSQGFLGRRFGYGSIHLPLANGTPDRFSDMREALELYREFQAVANGVDGDEWKPAVRQTIIP